MAVTVALPLAAGAEADDNWQKDPRLVEAPKSDNQDVGGDSAPIDPFEVLEVSIPQASTGDTLLIQTAEGELGVVIPEEGESVQVHADTFTGAGYELAVETGPSGAITAGYVERGKPQELVGGLDGNLSIEPGEGQPASSDDGSMPDAQPTPISEEPSGPDPLVVTTPECDDAAGGHDTNSQWNSTMLWYWDRDSTPSYLNLSKVEDDLRAAVTNITHVNNNCGRGDNVSAAASFEGYASDGPEISPQDVCGSNDQKSDIGWGTTSYAAVTCNWGNPRKDSDIKLNGALRWTTGACAGETSSTSYIAGPVTHERGHTWNLLDRFGHRNLTMGDANGNCGGPDAKTTLGKGDWQGLEANY